MDAEEYHKIIDGYRDKVIGNYVTEKIMPKRAVLCLGKLSEWEEEFKRKGGEK